MATAASAPMQRHGEQWTRAHALFGEELRRGTAVAESAEVSEPRRVDERLVQCVWHDGFLKPGGLTCASGKTVEIVEPGRWNTGRGPDFLDARIRLAGEEKTGDIEIHVQSSGWTAHSHHKDFEYNRVVLHVCLNASDDRPYDEKQNGERLERLVLAPHLEPDLDTLRRTINVDEYPWGRPADLGVCHRALLALPEERLRRFLEVAGRARVEDKVRRFGAQLAGATVPQLLYQSVMVGQGYKSNKTLYFLLSKRAPVAELLDYAQDVAPGERRDLYLSILLHVAQLFPSQADLFDGADDETRAFVDRLERLWRPVRGFFADRLMPPTRRWYSGMRPPGFPGRRLAAVAHLLDRMNDADRPLFAAIAGRIRSDAPAGEKPKEWREFVGSLAAMVQVEAADDYFATHYTPGGKPCKPQALLGEPAAESLLFNVFLPLVILTGDEAAGEAAWRVVSRFPSLDSNSVTDFMRHRLFGETGMDKILLKTELMQQALFKIFRDCCSLNERTCTDCTFLNAPFRPAE